MTETQETVSAWITETFGSAGSNLRVAIRANEEMSELLRDLANDDAHPKAAEEAADVVIILYRLFTRLGVNMDDVIDAKMAVNRARTWRVDDSGCGYHIADAS